MAATVRVEWELPADVELDEPFRAELQLAVQREVAVRLFAEGKISSGYGAHLLGISRWAFIDLLRERRIPLFQYGPGELEEELATIDRLFPRDTSRPEDRR